MKLSHIRLVGWIEALSFLLLLFVAMPLKYMGGNPIGVRVLGPIHGFLFIAFGVMVFSAYMDKKIDGKLVVLCGIGALLPFGPVLYHKKLEESPAEPASESNAGSPEGS